MKSARSVTQWMGITLRGVLMGAADVIPGVSGGTIAFITGIYEELITSISNINLSALKTLKEKGFSAFWKQINGNFFVALILGIGISAFTLAQLVTFLLEKYPVFLWSLFFGLILGSTQFMIKQIKKWDAKAVLAILVGTGIAVWISLLHTTASGDELWYIFLSGAIGICAMILPGISGAFILVLLGSYGIIIQGLKELDLLLIAIFAAGCLTGILAFSHLLKYLFKNFKNVVLALLSGFLLGSLVKIWPWKNPIGNDPIIVHSDEREEWMMTNVLPQHFDGSPQLFYAILLMVVGYLLIVVLEKVAPQENE